MAVSFRRLTPIEFATAWCDEHVDDSERTEDVVAAGCVVCKRAWSHAVEVHFAVASLYEATVTLAFPEPETHWCRRSHTIVTALHYSTLTDDNVREIVRSLQTDVTDADSRAAFALLWRVHRVNTDQQY